MTDLLTLFETVPVATNDFMDMPQRFNGAWRGVTELRPVGRHRVDWMVRRHYLGCWPAVQTCLLGMFCRGEVVGTIIYACPPREMCQRFGGEVWELARLWIDDSIPRNAETWLIGASVKFIKRHHRHVCALVSYADPSAGHSGTIYRAANWVYDGMTDSGRKTPRCDYRVGDKMYSRKKHIPDGVDAERVPRVAKHRFIYRLTEPQPLTRDALTPQAGASELTREEP